jgi:hypothetical protein
LLIGGKQPYVASFELTLDTRRIRRDPRETIDALDDHSEQRLPMVGGSQQQTPSSRLPLLDFPIR